MQISKLPTEAIGKPVALFGVQADVTSGRTILRTSRHALAVIDEGSSRSKALTAASSSGAMDASTARAAFTTEWEAQVLELDVTGNAVLSCCALCK